MLKFNLMTSNMEQVILGSNQAAVSGGVETASFYNPFKALKAASEVSVNSLAVEPATVVNDNDNQDTADTKITAKEAASVATVTEQNSAANSTAPPDFKVEREKTVVADEQTGVMEKTAAPLDTEVALDLPFPSTEQMGAEIDITPGSDDIKGTVFTDASQEEINKQQNQDVGGKQDVVGLLSHLTKSQDEQEGKYQAPKICEIDQKTGAWLGEGCQDEEVSVDQQEGSQDITENTAGSTETTAQLHGEKTDLSSDNVNDDNQVEEMTTHAPTSGEIEIEEVSFGESSKTPGESDETNSSAKLNLATESGMKLKSQLDKESALAAEPESALELQDSQQEIIAQTTPAVSEKNQVREHLKQDEKVNTNEQSPDEALERIKEHYKQQLAKESREGQILDLLAKLQCADERLLELKHQYTQIETSLRLWE